MLRPLFLGILLGFALLAGPLAAQKGTMVDDILVRGSADAIEVEIQTSGAPVSPNAQVIQRPDRIVLDFPSTHPSSELRMMTVNRGALKSVRSGLFSNNPPTTRIVLDLTEAQSYKISSSQNAVLVRLSAAEAAANEPASTPSTEGAQLHDAAFVGSAGAATPKLSAANMPSAQAIPVVSAITPAVTAEALKPEVKVSYENGMLSIHAEKASLSQVLFEVHLKTQAEIAIPAGAEREEVVANIGPGPAREVLGTLLNGSSYNFIFVGNELSLERVILTRREGAN